MKSQAATLITLALLAVLAIACGPKKNKGTTSAEGGGSVTGTGGGATASTTAARASAALGGKGAVYFQKIDVKGGKPVTATMKIGASLALADGPKDAPVEVSVTNPDGTETQFARTSAGDASVTFTPTTDGTVNVAVKDNGTGTAPASGVTVDGGAANGGLINVAARTDTPYGNILLKGIVALARNCLANNPATNHRDAMPAPDGRVYVQPFVFYGQVGADGKVTPLTSATITLTAGGETVTLKKLDDIDYHKYETDMVRGGAAIQLANAKSFYQGYFGAAGQMYTVDGFFSGECADSATLPLGGADIGTDSISLHITDATLPTALDKTYPVRPTIQPPFETYIADGVKLSDYTQCDYDKKTGEPATYNGTATVCKTFSAANPPYDITDYLPSKYTAGATSASDPTRLFFYGYATPKVWEKQIIADNVPLIAATKTAETLAGCLNTGGIIAMPLSTDKTFLPLKELNAANGDVINLARRTGSYTSFDDFYQGDVDASGTANLNISVPDPTGATYPTTFAVTTTGCTFKADSGLSALSLADAMVYPGYFEMSGVVAP